MSERTPTPGDEGPDKRTPVTDPKTTLPPDYTAVMKDAVASGSDEEDQEAEGEAPKPKPGRIQKETMVPTTEVLTEFTRQIVAERVRAAQAKEAKKNGRVIVPFADLRKRLDEEGGDK